MKTIKNKYKYTVINDCSKDLKYTSLVSNDNSSPISRPYIYNCPIGKYNDSYYFDHNNSMIIVSPKKGKLIHCLSGNINKTKNLILNTDGIKENKCISQQLNSTKGLPNKTQHIENSNNSSSIVIKDNGMSNSDFQNLVLDSLKEMKYAMSNLKSELNLQNETINRFDAFFKNALEETIDSEITNKSLMALDDIFPLKSEEELQKFEEQIKSDKIFRNNVISRLSMLNNIDDIGNSVKRIMYKMFSNEVASRFSLHGNKNKKKFSNHPTYHLLIDIIRPNDSKLKKMNTSLAIWLSLSKFRIECANTENNLKFIYCNQNNN